MKERPILFSAPMVQALLNGSKTQTRRALKVQPLDILPMNGEHAGREWVGLMQRGPEPKGVAFRCKFGLPGDRLWVRETHRVIWGQSPGYLIGVDYRADPQEKWERMRDYAGRSKWTPSIHMRREYSRILLEVVSVRVERLQDISDADARAEGIRMWADGACAPDNPRGLTEAGYFELLWSQINGACSWDDNPWVWVIEFKLVTP